MVKRNYTHQVQLWLSAWPSLLEEWIISESKKEKEINEGIGMIRSSDDDEEANFYVIATL